MRGMEERWEVMRGSGDEWDLGTISSVWSGRGIYHP